MSSTAELGIHVVGYSQPMLFNGPGVLLGRTEEREGRDIPQIATGLRTCTVHTAQCLGRSQAGGEGPVTQGACPQGSQSLGLPAPE